MRKEGEVAGLLAGRQDPSVSDVSSDGGSRESKFQKLEEKAWGRSLVDVEGCGRLSMGPSMLMEMVWTSRGE